MKDKCEIIYGNENSLKIIDIYSSGYEEFL